MNDKNIYKIVFGVTAIAVTFFLYKFFFQNNEIKNFNNLEIFQENKIIEQEISQQVIENEIEKRENIDDTANIKVETIMEAGVPFTSQAPSGDWSDQRFQNGCEEASVLMAMKLVENGKFTSLQETEKEIKEIAKFEEEKFGSFIDSSLEDVGRIFSEYYNFERYSIKNNITLDDLKKEINVGNILLIPTYGRALKNPNYTYPGPITHMLVVFGYDSAKKSFITNDPGTKNGRNYYYNENVLFGAIWKYPSGEKHPDLPKTEKMKKSIIVLELN